MKQIRLFNRKQKFIKYFGQFLFYPLWKKNLAFFHKSSMYLTDQKNGDLIRISLKEYLQDVLCVNPISKMPGSFRKLTLEI